MLPCIAVSPPFPIPVPTYCSPIAYTFTVRVMLTLHQHFYLSGPMSSLSKHAPSLILRIMHGSRYLCLHHCLPYFPVTISTSSFPMVAFSHCCLHHQSQPNFFFCCLLNRRNCCPVCVLHGQEMIRIRHLGLLQLTGTCTQPCVRPRCA